MPAAPPDCTALAELEALIAAGGPYLRAQTLCEVAAGERRFPVYALTLGNPDPALPGIGIVGGVHGLERIGAEVVLGYLASLVERLRWDSVLHRQLEGLRMVFLPLVNPGGFWRGTRANLNGVDLMRNAPVDAAEPVPFLLGGQRLSARLPWYRGTPAAMEAESAALCRVIDEELLPRPFSLVIDCHSGFGLHDRLWFPYAHTTRPIAHLAEAYALKTVFDASHRHHSYLIEPQSRQYLTHGDLWDYLYLRAAAAPERVFLPLTLEMGSWLWVKKNPRQAFSRLGIFNPLIRHRQQRVLRRHLGLLDFMARATCSHARWRPQGAAREAQRHAAWAHWYVTPRR